MRRLLIYVRRSPFKIVLWIIICVGACLSLWMAWDDKRRLPTIILGLTTAALAYQAARAPLEAVRERNETEARNKRAEMCEEPVRKVFDLFDEMFVSNTRASKARISDAEILERMIEIRKQMIIKGDADLVVAWEGFVNAVQSQKDPIEASERLFRALRRSIGHDDSSVRFGMLTAVYLKPEDKQKILEQGSGMQRE